MTDQVWLYPDAENARLPVPPTVTNNTAPSVTLRFMNGNILDVGASTYVLTPYSITMAGELTAGARVGFDLANLSEDGRVQNERRIFYEVASVEVRPADRSWLAATSQPVLYLTDPYAMTPCQRLNLVVVQT